MNARQCIALLGAISLSAASGCVASFDDEAPSGVEVRVGAHARVDEQVLLPGDRCPNGGKLLRSGTDYDEDGSLDDDEVSAESVLCNGAAGAPGEAGRAALLEREEVPPGDDCASGGWRLSTGYDDDGDGALSAAEVEVEGESVVCHGDDAAVVGATLGSLACAAGEVPAFMNDVWGCAPLPAYDGAAFALSGQGCVAGLFAVGLAPDGTLLCESAPDALSSLACAAGQIAKWTGAAWSCADDDTTAAGADTLTSLSCTDGEVVKWSADNGAWECAEDVDTDTDTDTDTLAGLSCAEGQVVKWSTADAAWQCGADETTAAGSDTLTSLSCADGEVAKWSAGDGVWECAADIDTDTDTDTDTLASLTCTAGQVAKWDGSSAWECADDVDTDTDTDTNTDTLLDLSSACGAGDVPKWNGAGWACAPDDDVDTDTDTLAALACTNGQLSKWSAAESAWVCGDDVDTDTDTNTDTLAALGCTTTGQIPKWTGAAWGCAADVDTDTDSDTLAGLSCTGGELAKWSQADGAWECAADLDTDTDTLVALGCTTAGQVPKWTGTAWECAADVDTDTDSDTLAGLSCADAELAKWSQANGAWKCAADLDTDTDTLAALGCTTAGHVPKWSGTAWECGADVDTNTDTDTLAGLPCADGQVPKWDQVGGAWICGTDEASPGGGGVFTTTIVVGGGATAQENGTMLLNAVAGIVSPSATSPYLVKVEPGVYDIGATPLQMRGYVDVEGSGRGVTTIRAAVIGASLGDGAIEGAAYSELRHLTVVNTGGGTYSYAVANDIEVTNLYDVALYASGGTNTVASLYSGGPDTEPAPRYRDVYLEPSGGPASCFGYLAVGGRTTPEQVEGMVVRVGDCGVTLTEGMAIRSAARVKGADVLVDRTSGPGTGIQISLATGPEVRLTHSRVRVQHAATGQVLGIGGAGTVHIADTSVVAFAPTGSAYGLRIGTMALARVDVAVAGANTVGVELRGLSTQISDIDVDVEAVGNATSAYGLRSRYGVSLTRSRIQVSGSAAFFRGIDLIGVSGVTQASFINHSTVQVPSGSALHSGLDMHARVGASRLSGSATLDASATLVCVHSYGADYTPLSSTCQ